MFPRKTLSTTEAIPAIVVVESNKLERRGLCRLLRAVGAQKVMEAISLEAVRRVLAEHSHPRWLLVADPDRMEDRSQQGLADLVAAHPDLIMLLLSGRRPSAILELRQQARQWPVPVVAVMSKPISGEEAETLLRRLASSEVLHAETPALSKDELNECLRGGRLHARFQPKVDLESGRAVACELLIHVTHPRRGEVTASGFSLALAQLGAHRVLTASVLREAASFVRCLRSKRLHAKVSIDLAVEVLSESGDARALDSYVRTLGVEPADLQFELDAVRGGFTAAAVMENLIGLRVCGYTLVLDRPSLALDSALPRQPFSEVKIDWTALTEARGEGASARSLSAALEQASYCGMAACAVGLRSGSDLGHARDAGFDLGQGEFFAAPMHAAEALSWMEREGQIGGASGREKLQDQAI